MPNCSKIIFRESQKVKFSSVCFHIKKKLLALKIREGRFRSPGLDRVKMRIFCGLFYCVFIFKKTEEAFDFKDKSKAS